MALRTAEDFLREEYSALLPSMRRAAEELEAEVRHVLVPIAKRLESYERLVIKVRVKECESALNALRRRQPGKTFTDETPSAYSLRALNDLAGLRILAFPTRLVLHIDEILRARFPLWTADPIPRPQPSSQPLALKYHGHCSEHAGIRVELQIVPMLIGLFWEVEHAALYKPSPVLSGVVRAEEMRQRNEHAIEALEAFDHEFDQATADFSTR